MTRDVTFSICWIKKKQCEYSRDIVFNYDGSIEESKINKPPVMAVFVLYGNGDFDVRYGENILPELQEKSC